MAKYNVKNFWRIIIIIVLGLVSCQVFSPLPEFISLPDTSSSGAESTLVDKEAVPQKKAPSFGAVKFSLGVNDAGEPVYPSTLFPGVTKIVWALFTYQNIEPGQTWGYRWLKDGEVHTEVKGITWDAGEKGWIAYSISDETGLLGHYTFTLFLGDEPVQEASFDVAPLVIQDLSDSAAFGVIRFTHDQTKEDVPVQANYTFDHGIQEIFATFNYLNMSQGQTWSQVWLRDGAIQAREDSTWEEGQDGITSIVYRDETGLQPGFYTLKLYIDRQLVSSADFEVIVSGEENDGIGRKEASENLIDFEMLPAWQLLASSESLVLQDLAQFVLDEQIEIRLEEEFTVPAAYQYDCNPTRPIPGRIIFSQEYWQNHSLEEVSAALGHELTHAVQIMTGGKCECTVEREFDAFLIELYILQEFGRTDILTENYSAFYSIDGRFNRDHLWAVIKNTYTQCSEY